MSWFLLVSASMHVRTPGIPPHHRLFSPHSIERIRDLFTNAAKDDETTTNDLDKANWLTVSSLKEDQNWLPFVDVNAQIL
jgi:hypothetical protein